MYDTVKFRLESDEAGRIPGLLTGVETRFKQTGEYRQYGSLDNMRVSVGDSSLTVQGSLSKYLNGNNFERFTRKQTQRAIEKLSDCLSLPIQRAKVERIDIAANFILSRPVREYMIHLGMARYFKRFTYDYEGLRYKGGMRQLVFYNKVKECQDKKHSGRVPEVFQGRNVLRYELRFLKRPKRQFKSEIRAVDLYNQNFYSDKIKRWKDAYFKIKKIGTFKDKGLPMKGVKDCKEYLEALCLTDAIRREMALNRLERAREDEEMNDRAYYRCKKLLGNENYFEPNDCILELDQKIRQAAEFHR